MTPTTCPWVQQCLLPFSDGLFPGWITRDQYGDRAIPADDTVLIAKVPPFDPFGHMPATDAPAAPQITAASLAVSTPGLPWHPAAPITPWGPILPPDVDYPCMCITPPVEPAPVPVPIPASAGLLIAAVAAFAIIRMRI